MKLNFLIGFMTLVIVESALINPNVLKDALEESNLVSRDEGDSQAEISNVVAERNIIDIERRSNETVKRSEEFSKRSNETVKRSNETKRDEVEPRGLNFKRHNGTHMVIQKRFANLDSELRRAHLDN